jgi:hypothetical protein
MKGLTWPNYKGEPRHLSGVPSPKDGYGPGVVFPLTEAGMTEDEAKAAIEGSPLKLVEIKETKGGEGK